MITPVPPLHRKEPILHLDLQGVHKWYGDFQALRDVTLRVKRGERIVICGPSGSGKSTLIRCINRLEQHQRGRIVVNGVELMLFEPLMQRIRVDFPDPDGPAWQSARRAWPEGHVPEGLEVAVPVNALIEVQDRLLAVRRGTGVIIARPGAGMRLLQMLAVAGDRVAEDVVPATKR